MKLLQNHVGYSSYCKIEKWIDSRELLFFTKELSYGENDLICKEDGENIFKALHWVGSESYEGKRYMTGKGQESQSIKDYD